MPTYVYEALNAAGKPEKGRIEADTSDAAIAAIRQNGFFPTTVREEKIRGGSGKNEGKKDATKKKIKKKSVASIFLSVE
jgi:type II secretory pathway component PulF